jgi:hypothetical protein
LAQRSALPVDVAKDDRRAGAAARLRAAHRVLAGP